MEKKYLTKLMEKTANMFGSTDTLLLSEKPVKCLEV